MSNLRNKEVNWVGLNALLNPPRQCFNKKIVTFQLWSDKDISRLNVSL